MAISFQKDGDEYLWLRDKNFESTDAPAAASRFCSRAAASRKAACICFGGQAYPIEIHGFADLLPWSVAKAEDEAIELTLTPKG